MNIENIKEILKGKRGWERVFTYKDKSINNQKASRIATYGSVYQFQVLVLVAPVCDIFRMRSHAVDEVRKQVQSRDNTIFLCCVFVVGGVCMCARVCWVVAFSFQSSCDR